MGPVAVCSGSPTGTSGIERLQITYIYSTITVFLHPTVFPLHAAAHNTLDGSGSSYVAILSAIRIPLFAETSSAQCNGAFCESECYG